MYLITFYFILIAFGFIVDCLVSLHLIFFCPHTHTCATRACEYSYMHSIFIISAAPIHTRIIFFLFLFRIVPLVGLIQCRTAECEIQPKGNFPQYICICVCFDGLFIIFEKCDEHVCVLFNTSVQLGVFDGRDEHYLFIFSHVFVNVLSPHLPIRKPIESHRCLYFQKFHFVI